MPDGAGIFPIPQPLTEMSTRQTFPESNANEGNESRAPVTGEIFLSTQLSIQWAPRALSPGKGGKGVKPTTHLTPTEDRTQRSKCVQQKLRGLSPGANYTDRATAEPGDPLRSYSPSSRPQRLLLLPSSSSVVLSRLSGPRSTSTTTQKVWQCRESNPDLWICSQEL
jgi:hypothetical protein